MSNILNLKGVKLFAIIVLAAAILATFGMVAVQSASADTVSLTTCATLRQGSTGDCVRTLQAALNANGAVPQLTIDGVFGPMTKAAVMAYQSTQDALVADGIVGPLTKAQLAGTVVPTEPLCPNGNTLASNCMTAPAGAPAGPTCPNGNLIANNCAPAGTDNGPLAGTAGTVTYTQLSQYTNEKVGAGVTDVKVAGFELEASDGDVSLRSFKLTFI